MSRSCEKIHCEAAKRRRSWPKETKVITKCWCEFLSTVGWSGSVHTVHTPWPVFWGVGNLPHWVSLHEPVTRGYVQPTTTAMLSYHRARDSWIPDGSKLPPSSHRLARPPSSFTRSLLLKPQPAELKAKLPRMVRPKTCGDRETMGDRVFFFFKEEAFDKKASQYVIMLVKATFLGEKK